MIISVEELKEHITTDKTDSVLEGMLQALELKIRSYTNNRFHQFPSVRVKADIKGGVFIFNTLTTFKVGDTVQVTVGDRAIDCGIYTIKESNSTTFTVNEDVPDMAAVDVIKVRYPHDVKMGVVDIMEWKLKNQDKVGLTSETISRHSQTFDRTSINKKFGVPNDLVGFLNDHIKARF